VGIFTRTLGIVTFDELRVADRKAPPEVQGW